METTLLVSSKLTFSEYLRCLNFPLWTFWPAKTKQVKESDLFWDKAPTRSGRFKHLKFSENDKFSGTNSVDSILVVNFFTKNFTYLISPWHVYGDPYNAWHWVIMKIENSIFDANIQYPLDCDPINFLWLDLVHFLSFCKEMIGHFSVYWYKF